MASALTGLCFVILGLILIRQYRVYTWGRCKAKRTMKGKTVVITGANSGIGKATAKELAQKDARVILACRDLVKAQSAAEEIRKVTQNGQLILKCLDLASFASIREFVEDVLHTETRIDVLINNAGIFQCPYMITDDGLEMQMGVNHFGHFLLTILLLDFLKKSAPSRIIVLTSALYKKGQINFDNLNSEQKYDKREAYNNSKLANVLFVRELHRRFHHNNVNVYAVSPGHVYTNLGRHLHIPWYKLLMMAPLAWFFVRTPKQGCQTVLHCAMSEDLDKESGKYYRNCSVESYNDVANDQGLAKKLWEVSEEVTNTKQHKMKLKF
ncbi:retinol dehydrogenase 14-like [Centruroides vittatus]|uniref:retinol dehydrogenase 14-like n=1 Tax=Centruroides vittatus TaxID=120091 RepID=UPI0035105276